MLLPIIFVKEPQLFYGQVLDVCGLTHFLFHYLPYDFESRDEISFRGRIVTPQVF